MFTVFNILLQVGRTGGRGKYTVPYDSTQGVSGTVFLIFWIIILLFGIRLAWEYRDKIFPKNIPEKQKATKGKKPTITK